MKGFGLIVGAAVVLYALRAYSFAKKYRVSFFGLTVDKKRTAEAGFKNLFFKVGLALENPTEFAAKIISYRMKFFYKGIPVGLLDEKGSLVIPAKNRATFWIPVALNIAQVVTVAPAIFNELTTTGKISLSCSGVVGTAEGSYKFSKDFTIKVFNGGSSAS